MVHPVGIMGAPKKPEIQEKDLRDFRYFNPPLARPRNDGCRGLSCPAEGQQRRLNWGDWSDRSASLVADVSRTAGDRLVLSMDELHSRSKPSS